MVHLTLLLMFWSNTVPPFLVASYNYVHRSWNSELSRRRALLAAAAGAVCAVLVLSLVLGPRVGVLLPTELLRV